MHSLEAGSHLAVLPHIDSAVNSVASGRMTIRFADILEVQKLLMDGTEVERAVIAAVGAEGHFQVSDLPGHDT